MSSFMLLLTCRYVSHMVAGRKRMFSGNGTDIQLETWK